MGKRAILVAGIFSALLFSNSASAGHIDELGINVFIYSNDGAGNFVVQYDEYFGSDGWMWSGGAWTATYAGSPLTYSLDAGPGVLTKTSPDPFDTRAFIGLVDAGATPTAGFGAGQINTQFINDLTDAALYSALVSFSIAGYDPNETYLVSIASNDCCFVVGSGGPNFNSQFQFDPRIIIIPGGGSVPEPIALGLIGLGLGGLGVARRARRKRV